MGTQNRFVGCLLGVAVGDSIGAQTLGSPDPSSVPLVNTPALRWTDSTQQLVLTGTALLEALRCPWDRRVLGRAVANRLVRWYHDPALVYRYPPETTLRAVVRLLQGVDWEESGSLEDDGAAPLVGAVAVGLAYAPDEVVEPAQVVTRITHAHPTALQGAVLVAHVISRLARGEPLWPELWHQGCALAEAAVPEGRATASVVLALDLAQRLDRRTLACLDPRQIPEGDCGRRTASALGLAALLAHRFDGPPDWRRLEAAVATAATIPGASQVVAALTAAILGAAWGLGALPRHLVERVEDLDELVDLGRALHWHAHALTPDAENRGVEHDTEGGWSSPPAPVRAPWARPPAGGATDPEWAEAEDIERRIRNGNGFEESSTALEPLYVESGEGAVQWIVVGDESVEEMERADADLLAGVRRRW